MTVLLLTGFRRRLLNWLDAVERPPYQPPKPAVLVPLSDGLLRAERPEHWASPDMVLLTLERGESSMKVRVPTDSLRQIADRFDVRADWEKAE